MTELEKEQVKNEVKAASDVLRSLDHAIQTGPWERSLFLGGIGKRLRELREGVQEELDAVLNKAQVVAEIGDGSIAQEVYITLYQSQGADLHRWWQVVVSLVNYSISRPVYKQEMDAKAAVRMNDHKLNHAYIVVKISPEDVTGLSDEGQRLDREGRELLVLREAAIELKNIVRFVHASGEYKLQGNALVKQGEKTASL